MIGGGMLLLLLLVSIASAACITSGYLATTITSGQPTALPPNGTQPISMSDTPSISNPSIVQDDETLLGGTKREPVYANDPPLPQLFQDERTRTRGRNLFGVRYNDPFELMQLTINMPSQIATKSRVISRVSSVWVRRMVKGTVRRVVRYDKVLRISSLMQALRLHYLASTAMFRIFSFKGVGLSFVKSAVKWRSFGFGFRIPITPHFPEYDRLLHLPRISTFAGISYPLDYRFSISASFPLHVVTDALSAVACDLRLASKSWIESMNSKATDSVKRVGLTLTFRYNPIHRLRVGIGPWWFFLPGQRTMEMVLPVLFFVPALLLAAVNLFVTIDSRSFFYDEVEDIYAEHAMDEDPSADIPTLDQLDDLVVVSKVASAEGASGVAEDLKANTMVIRREGEELEETREALPATRGSKYGGVSYWHKEVLQWASTRVCGLGYNIGWYRSSDNDKYVGSSVMFDVQPFFFRRLRRLSRAVGPAVRGLFSSGPRPAAKSKRRVRRKIKVRG